MGGKYFGIKNNWKKGRCDFHREWTRYRFHLCHSQFLSKRAISLFVGSDLSQYGEIEKRLIFGRNWLEDKDGNKKGNTRREKSLTSQFGAKWLASERKWSKRKKGKKVADDCVKIRLSSKEKKLVFFIASCKRFFFFFLSKVFQRTRFTHLKRPRISILSTPWMLEKRRKEGVAFPNIFVPK